MYLSPSPYNRPDETVREIQNKLNSIRLSFHHSWDYLTTDGIYGKNSAAAVKAFQQYKGIMSQGTPQGPILGDTTIEYIRQEYRRIPVMSSASPTTVVYTPPAQDPKFGFNEFFDACMTIIGNFDSFLKNELEYIRSMTTNNPKALTQRYKSMATRLDPRMKEIKELLNKKFKTRKQTHKNAIKIQGERINLITELEKFDLVGKIEKKVASMGITKNMKMNSPKNANVKLKGGGVFVLWSFKDLIMDVVKVDQWGTETWKAEVRTHFMEFLDGFLIGIAANLIAELIMAGVAAGVAALGFSMPVWLIIALIAILGCLIAMMFQFFLDDHNISFSEMLMDLTNKKVVPAMAKWQN